MNEVYYFYIQIEIYLESFKYFNVLLNLRHLKKILCKFVLTFNPRE